MKKTGLEIIVLSVKTRLRLIDFLVAYQWKGWRMVNARLCETARPGFFFASPRHFDVLCCESETLNRFECERETLRFQKFESLTYVS